MFKATKKRAIDLLVFFRARDYFFFPPTIFFAENLAAELAKEKLRDKIFETRLKKFLRIMLTAEEFDAGRIFGEKEMYLLMLDVRSYF